MRDDTELVTEVALRARQKEGRPRMSDDVEKRLEPLERDSAAMYANMELAAHRCRRLAEALDLAEELEAPQAVPEDFEEEDSLVHHLEEIRAKAKSGVK